MKQDILSKPSGTDEEKFKKQQFEAIWTERRKREKLVEKEVEKYEEVKHLFDS